MPARSYSLTVSELNKVLAEHAEIAEGRWNPISFQPAAPLRRRVTFLQNIRVEQR